MLPTSQGSFRLFRIAGITVYLHFTWLFVAMWEVSGRTEQYASRAWNLIEYLALFGIVLLHEFGHALACRQVGGRAEQIVLWPLGGVAYVAPPPRPGAVLWCIAAGPLVNVLLVPVFLALFSMSGAFGWKSSLPDLHSCLYMLQLINLILLAFNLLPIYPLDGGQILRALLWFPLGRGRSLQVATVVGFVGLGGLVVFAMSQHSPWMGVMCLFAGLNCWRGWQESRRLLQVEALPRREGFACPLCGKAPPMGNLWGCSQCRQPFDTFATGGTCPHCAAHYEVTRCPECGGGSARAEWRPSAAPVLPHPAGAADPPGPP